MKKKLLGLALASLMLTSSAAYAAADKAPHALDVAPQVLDQAPVTQATDDYSIQAALSVPLYSQSGQTWSSKIMSTCGTTISAEGCALTSVAMVFKYYGVSVDPGTLNTKLGSSACPMVWGDAVSKAGAGIVNTVSVTGPTTWTSVMSAAKTAINAGKPYIVGFYKPTGTTHFVVVKGYSGTGSTASEFTINDPAGGVSRALSYYATSTPYRGVVYSK